MPARTPEAPARAAHAGGKDDRTDGRGRLPFSAAFFLVSLLVPLVINLGSLRLSIYRLVLVALFIPCLYYLFTGRAGRVRVPDVCVILICFWSTLSFIVVHGLSSMVEPIGITILETMGSYLLGRCLIRTPQAFYSMVRILFVLGIIVLPLALYETVTGQNISLKIIGILGQTPPEIFAEKRLGLNRVQGPFEHPILFGVFFGSLVGVTFYVLGYGRSAAGRISRVFLLVFTSGLALSSGPLSAVASQLLFITWDRVLKAVRARWYILLGITAICYVVIDLLSNRTPIHVFITYFSFNTHTAYVRIFIWEWGMKNIFDNPVFGIGFNDWERLPWMTSSVDMFWILPAMRHGVVVLVLYLVMFFWIFLSITYLKNLSEKMNWYRSGYLSTIFGFFVCGWTVHYWNATFVFFMFMLGCGIWMLDYKERPSNPDVKKKAKAFRVPNYTRFHSSSADSPRA